MGIHEPAGEPGKGAKRRWAQFGLRGLWIAMTVAALLVAWYANRHRVLWRAAAELRRQEVSFKTVEPPWYDRLPGIEPPPWIESLYLTSRYDMERLAPPLAAAGTLRQVSTYGLSVRDMELLATIGSVESVEASHGLTAEHVRPLAALRLREFSVNGADVNIPPEGLEVLYTIPTLRSIGTAHGERAVPRELRERRPEIEIYITDFPP